MIPRITVRKLIIRQLYKVILRAIHAWHVYWQQTAATQLQWFTTISHSTTEISVKRHIRPGLKIQAQLRITEAS